MSTGWGRDESLSTGWSHVSAVCVRQGSNPSPECSWLVCGFFFLLPFQPLTLDRREKRVGKWKGVTLSLGYFLMIRSILFLWASFTFTIRMSNFSLFLLCTQLLNKLWPPTTNQQHPKIHHPFWGPSIYIPPEKVPELQMSHNGRNYLQLAKAYTSTRARGKS